MSTAMFHKHDSLEDDLLALACDVPTSAPCLREQGSARDAARAISGLVGWVANRVGLIRMQEVFAELARHVDAWRPGNFMRDLPTGYNGTVDEYVAMVAVVSSSLVHAYSPANLRAAMAFWATERDPAQWQAMVEA